MGSPRAQSTRMGLRTKAAPAKSSTEPKMAKAQRQHGSKKHVGNSAEIVSVNTEEEAGNEDGDREQPATRRAKRHKHAYEGHVARQKAGGEVLSILSLPFDIQLETLSWLNSKDLISLSHTNRELRKILMHRGGTKVWKLARETGDVPEPSPAMSEQQWAILLFGEPRCSECAAPMVKHIDFGLRRRVCLGCKRANLVHTQKFRRDYPEYDEVLLDMIPYTHVGGWTSSYRTGVRYYWLQDIYDISKQWAKLQDAIRWREPGARQKAAEFLQARKDLVKSIQEGVRGYQDWHESLLMARTAEINDEYRKRCNQIIAKFEELGYEMVDICIIRTSEKVIQRRPLTDRIWKRIRPHLEDMIKEKRQFRVVQNRKAIFKNIYPGYLSTLPPPEWPYHPTVTDAMELPALKSVIGSQWGIWVTQADLEALLPLISDALSTWRAALKEELTEKALHHYHQLYQPTPVPAKKGRKGKTHVVAESTQAASLLTPSDPLNLVTSVFVCSRCQGSNYCFGKSFAPAWFGWDGALRHSCPGPTMRLNDLEVNRGTLEISQRGSKVAARLAEEIGLDPQTATIEDMDKVGAKWFCETCENFHDMVYDWKAVVAHAMSWNHPDGVPELRRLTDHQLKNVQFVGEPQYSSITRDWACAHCDAHFRHWRTKDQVKHHLHATHKIEEPAEKDMVHFFSRVLFEPMAEKCHAPPEPADASAPEET